MRYFRTLVELPEIKVGAILEGNGTGYYAKTKVKHESNGVFYSTRTVEREPKFFVEVFEVTPKYVTKEDAKKKGIDIHA